MMTDEEIWWVNATLGNRIYDEHTISYGTNMIRATILPALVKNQKTPFFV